MRKKEIFWICLLVLLGAVYVHYFGHWFDKQQIYISASIRPNRRPGSAEPFVVAFSLNTDYRLTALKVLPLDGTNFNPNALPVWNLESDSNSAPIRAFRYGQPIRGMKAALKNVRPEALKPGVAYRLLLTAGQAKGYKDFKANITGE